MYVNWLQRPQNCFIEINGIQFLDKEASIKVDKGARVYFKFIFDTPEQWEVYHDYLYVGKIPYWHIIDNKSIYLDWDEENHKIVIRDINLEGGENGN